MGKYIAFDVETPNIFHNRICQIGITILNNDKIEDSFSYLVNPETDFSYSNVRVHGITEYDVMFSPTFPEIWEIIRPILRSGTVIAHNASFDMRVLKSTLLSYGIFEDPFKYLCTLQASRRIVKDIENHKLNTLCERFSIPLNHHDAGSDSCACALLLFKLISLGLDPLPLIKEFNMQ